MEHPTNADSLLELMNKRGILRAKDLASRGLPRITLTRLVREGRVHRISRGLYTLPDADVSEHHALAQTCRQVPHGVVCLLSALRFHGLTTQEPFEVWLAIDRKARKPRIDYPPARIVRFAEEMLTRGVEKHEVEGVPVSVTSPARTVADCFRYRNKIGLDVAIEALRDYRRLRRGTMDDLWEAAKVARARTVIQPYLEALE